MDITFLLGSSLVAVLVVQVLKDLIGKLEGRFGTLWTQVLLLLVSFGIAGVEVLLHKLPPMIIETTGAVFVSAMAIYEVFVKAIYKKVIRNQK